MLIIDQDGRAMSFSGKVRDGALSRVLFSALMLAVVTLLLVTGADAKKARPEGLVKVALTSLHPTQGAVGMREAGVKRAEVLERASDPKRLDKFLAKHAIPVVVGPNGLLYLIDHHHLGLALWQAQVAEVYVSIEDDLSSLTIVEFWKRMEAEGKVHAFDQTGRKIDPSELPDNLGALKDDPYRDLAGSVRDAGGFDKTKAPFSEFSWADFFRARVAAGLIASDYDAAVRQGMVLAHGAEAAALPGFNGRR